MGPRKLHVDLDELDLLDHDWLFVVLHAASGVVHHLQYGGTSCLQGAVEGHLVPVQVPDSYAALVDLFVGDFHGTGGFENWHRSAHADRLRAAVEAVHLPVEEDAAALRAWPFGSTLRLDDDRLDEACESWIPVDTPHGKGTLVWSNSD
ncbi:DUF6210 family protein [Yinghuangia sp. YIM S09857]|uniref:DUF6210 family protein n=1 Tax=Yinghuangia sp. YIM S09857 TaxID=3436929 RepID=UPI003F537A45